MPADSFVGIWKFIARPNLCEIPACVKPPPRCTPFWGERQCNIEKTTKNESMIFFQKKHFLRFV